MYSLLLLLLYGYAQVKSIEGTQSMMQNASRFFKMGLKLPPEIQMRICEMSQGLPGNPKGIENNRITPALKSMLKGFK